MKPRIYRSRFDGVPGWVCTDSRALAWAESIREAYAEWKQAVTGRKQVK